MLVADILKAKGATTHSITAKEAVASALSVLCSKRIGALLVLDDAGEIVGILSERDLIRGMNNFGPGVFDKSVGDLMSTPVTTCSPKDPIAAIMGMMTSGRFRHVPVVDDGRLVGIISIGDVVKSRIEEAQAEVDALRLYISL
jgi:CBS domain-containing protein